MYKGLHYVWLLFPSWIKIILHGQPSNLIQEGKVLSHICVENVINDVFPHAVILLGSELLEYVAVVIFHHKEERGRMMILQDSLVIVESRKL
jgi:hypothetical protein